MRKWLAGLSVLGLMLCASMVRAEYRYTIKQKQVKFSNAEAMNSVGDYFTTINNAELSAGATIWYLVDLTTATKNIYLDFEVESSTGAFWTKIGREPTVSSSGTISTTIFNFNQASRKPSVMSDHLYTNTGVIPSNGTLLFVGSHRGLAMYRNPVTWVLEAGGVYSIVAQNAIATTQRLQLRLSWYER